MDQSENRFYREKESAPADGGPAFPVADRDVAHAAGSAAIMGVTDTAERDRLYAEAYNKAVRGMSLRDYFIAHIGDENQGDEGCDYADSVKALLVGRPCPSGPVDGWLAVLQFEADFRAAWRVMRADAMLRARGAA